MYIYIYIYRERENMFNLENEKLQSNILQSVNQATEKKIYTSRTHSLCSHCNGRAFLVVKLFSCVVITSRGGGVTNWEFVIDPSRLALKCSRITKNNC